MLSDTHAAVRAFQFVKHRWFKSLDLPESMEIFCISTLRYVKYKMVLHNKCSHGGNYCKENVFRERLFPSFLTKGTKWGPTKGFPRHPYATGLPLHQRLVTEGIISLCVWTHEARAAGQQVYSRENGKLDSVNVPLFDLLRNFQITSALEYTTEARQPVFIGWVNHLEVIPK